MESHEKNTSKVRPDEITVAELKQWMDSGKVFTMLDIREPWELAQAAFRVYHPIRLGLLEESLDQLPTDRPLVVVCHHGRRSLAACHILRHNGFSQARSLQGGIHLWATQMDPTMQQYGL